MCRPSREQLIQCLKETTLTLWNSYQEVPEDAPEILQGTSWTTPDLLVPRMLALLEEDESSLEAQLEKMTEERDYFMEMVNNDINNPIRFAEIADQAKRMRLKLEALCEELKEIGE